MHLQLALSFLARSHLLAGELTTAALMIEEDRLIAEATGNPPLRKRPDDARGLARPGGGASELIEATLDEATARGWTSNAYASSVLYNGLGRHDAARDAAWQAFERDPVGAAALSRAELAEAASQNR